ncbi:MAG: flagellin N-terminal helical domain-containing protein [Planctomycetota bacterium]|jgi:flagellin
MALIIRNNIMAENAARQLGLSYDGLSKSIERLSSGLRINSAKDDAAGLAVRELMRADIAVLKQGARNAQDGISMLQTMEGAMAAIDDALIRMKELAEQAATGSYSDQQRRIMNNEFAEMRDEITRVAERTEFNATTMLDSATGTNTIHFGIDSSGNSSSITVNSVDVTAATLGITSAIAIDSTTAAATALTTVNTAINVKDSARASFGYSMNRLESSTGVLNIQAENLLAAESRVSDVDVSTEMASMTRNQVLAQAGVSMLAQANTTPQMALTLLR